MATTLTQLLNYAQNHAFIQAVGTEGSTNDASVPDDQWQDTDVTFFTNDVTQFDFADWTAVFGQPTIVRQEEPANPYIKETADWRIFLTQFADSSRIDLKIAPVTAIAAYLANDSLNTIVWSRDGSFQPRETSDASARLYAPTQAAFDAMLNTFYWHIGNVAKGLGRDKFLYAVEINNQLVRPQLLQGLAWVVASARGKDGFNPGPKFQNLADHLPKDVYVRLQQTYRQENVKKLRHSALLEASLMIWTQQRMVQYAGLRLPDYLANRIRQLDDWINRI